MTVIMTVFIVLAGLLISMRVFIWIKTSKMKGMDAPLSHNASRKRIKSGKKTILYFFTPQCGACRVQEPIFEKVRKDYPDALFKIDATQNQHAAKTYGVLGVPFVVYIAEAKIIKASSGVQQEAAITGFMQKEISQN